MAKNGNKGEVSKNRQHVWRTILIRQDKLKNGKAPIYARITLNGEIIHFALKQWVDPKYWDPRKGYGKGNRDEISTINNGLEQARVVLAKHYWRFRGH